MTAFAPRTVEYNVESSFAALTNTFDTRIPVVDVRHNFENPRFPDARVHIRQNRRSPGYRLTQDGSFEIDFYLGGHGGTTVGALTENWIQELLKSALGGGDVTQVGGTVVTSGTSTTALAFSGATFVRGGLIRVGAENDGRAGGQWVVVGSTITSPASVLTAMPAAPQDPDVIYAAQLAYPTETGQQTLRFLLGWSGSGQQWVAYGCQAEAIQFRYAYGQLIGVTIRYRCALWKQVTLSVPQNSSIEECAAAPVTAGSVFYQTYQTNTRATKSPFEVEITLELGLAEKPGPGGAPGQRIVGWERTFCHPAIKLVLPQEDLDAFYNLDGPDTVRKHILVGASTVNKRAVAFYFPNVWVDSPKPTIREFNGLAACEVMFQADESEDTTNERTRAPIIIATA